MPVVLIAFGVALQLVITAIVLAVVLASRRRAAAGRTAVARADDSWAGLAAGLGGRVDGRGAAGEIDGKPYRLCHEAGTRKHTVSLVLRVDHPFPDELKLVTEGGFHRLTKRLGLAVEVESGEAAFDERFYVHADNPAYARAYLACREHTARLVALADAATGLSESLALRLHRRGLEVRLVNYRRGALDAERSRGLLAAAAAVAGPVPDPVADLARPASTGDVAQRAAWLGLSFLGLAAGIAALIYGQTRYEPIESAIYPEALGGAGIAWLVFLALAFLLVRGRSWSGWVFLVVLCCSVPTFITGGLGVQLLRNGALDTAPEVERRSRVLSLYTTRSKNSTTYHLIVAPWREGMKPPHLRVSPRLHRELREGGPVTLVTRPGALGHEWLVRVVPAAPPAPGAAELPLPGSP